MTEFCRNLKAIRDIDLSSTDTEPMTARKHFAAHSGPIRSADTLVRSRAVVSREIAEETLIVPIRGNVGDLASIYSFNHTGTIIWNLMEKQHTLAEVIDSVAAEYDLDPERVEMDVRNFVEEMLSVGLVELGTLSHPSSG